MKTELIWVNLMNKATRSLRNFVLGIITCVLVVVFSTTPSFSNQPTLPVQNLDLQRLRDNQTEMAQGMMGGQSMKRYSTMLSGSNVAPKAATTNATGSAQATLMGDRLTVRGSFKGLSSELRDYTTDPTNPPNPKITSAVHIHRGEATENGPFQFTLTVKMDDMKMGMGMGMGMDKGMSGKFSGEYTLSAEQLQALADGKLYLDLHTKQNRAGELRGTLRPA